MNLTGTFLMIRGVLPHMLDGGGAIVNIASNAGLMGQPFSAAYCASKGGVVNLTRALGVEYRARGVRVNAVATGWHEHANDHCLHASRRVRPRKTSRASRRRSATRSPRSWPGWSPSSRPTTAATWWGRSSAWTVASPVADPGLWELVEARAAEAPDAVLAIDEDGRTLTGREFRDAAERAAAGLLAHGVGPDVNVSWMLPTWLESAVLVAALARLGAIQNPMLPILGPREMRFIAGQTGASLLIVPSEWRGRAFADEAREIAKEQPGLEVLVADHALPEGDPSTLPPPPAPTSAADAPVRWIFYTSGTTADPKGARHTDLTVKASAIGMIEALEVTDADRAAMVFPFTHIGGIGWLFTMLITGCVCIFVEAFVPATTIPVLQRERVTLAGAGTPFHMAYLAAQRDQPDTPLFPEARAYPGGGAPKPPQLHYEVKARARRRRHRVGLRAHRDADPHDEHRARHRRAARGDRGCPTPGVELRIVTLDGKVAGEGEEGEIRAKGPQVFRGYLDASLDAAAFDEDGWFRTGDLGKIDRDGHVLITGRVKDIIIRHGENISAKELEDLLFTHPKIADVAVIGLARPADRRACVRRRRARERRRAADARGALRVPHRTGDGEAEGPRAARDRRRAAAQPGGEDPQARAARDATPDVGCDSDSGVPAVRLRLRFIS